VNPRTLLPKLNHNKTYVDNTHHCNRSRPVTTGGPGGVWPTGKICWT